MATENIVSKVYRVLTDVSSRVWDKISFWCLAKDVELANGKNLETTCGSITGITSSLTSTSTTMAASASAIKQLNDKIADLNSNLSYKTYMETFAIGTGEKTVTVDGIIKTVMIVRHNNTTNRIMYYNSDFYEDKIYAYTASSGSNLYKGWVKQADLGNIFRINDKNSITFDSVFTTSSTCDVLITYI